MTKKTLLYSFLISLLLVSCTSKEKGEYDTRAIESLDKLSETIGNLNACSYTTKSFNVDKDGLETSKLSDVYLRDSNKMYVQNSGTNGDKSFWYDGEKFSYFLYEKNEYDILDAPDNILKVIDSINKKYGIHFSAADFLYPTLTDDVLSNFDSLLYFGEENIDNINCISLEASNDNSLVQFWIEKETNLPYKMVILSKVNENEYYEAVYSNWRVNPKLPDVMFKFQPPAGSVRKKL